MPAPATQRVSEQPISELGYFAFISYSHQDKLWADWLHKTLETWYVPSRLVGQTTAIGVIPKRLTPIFSNRNELAGANDLNRKVNATLGHSAHLSVICSPHSAVSRLGEWRSGHTAVADYCADDGIEANLSARDPIHNDQCNTIVRVRAILGHTLAQNGDDGTGSEDLQEAVDSAARTTAAGAGIPATAPQR